MKKIMFKNTQAVIDGRQTMTRRIIKVPNRTIEGKEVCGFEVYKNHKGVPYDVWLTGPDDESLCQLLPTYKIGEVVAVAQAYKDLKKNGRYENGWCGYWNVLIGDKDVEIVYAEDTAGWSNKRFVEAELMPHRIRITDIKIEKLQECSDDDMLKEGILQSVDGMDLYTFDGWVKHCKGHNLPIQIYTKNIREAFAALIDKVNGKGTWESNLWEFAYSFELVKGGEE